MSSSKKTKIVKKSKALVTFSDKKTFTQVRNGIVEIIDLETGEVLNKAVKRRDIIGKHKYEYTVIQGDIIAQYIREGNSIARVGRMKDMPSAGIIHVWASRHPDFKEKLAYARNARADHFRDKVEDEVAKTDEMTSIHKDELSLKEFRTRNYRWMAAVDSPENYGGKLADNKITNTGPVQIVIQTGVPSPDPIPPQLVTAKQDIIEVKKTTKKKKKRANKSN